MRADLDLGGLRGKTLADSVKDTRQLFLFDDSESFSRLDSRLWRGSFQSRESTFQQLSPYVGKMKSGMAKALIKLYSKRGNVVLDPFSGSGVVPLKQSYLGESPGPMISVHMHIPLREEIGCSWKRKRSR